MLCSEMKKLRDLLDERGIKWSDRSEQFDIASKHFMERTRFDNTKGETISVIHGYGSYGGVDAEGVDHGLLEALNLKDDEQVGWITAEEVIDIFY